MINFKQEYKQKVYEVLLGESKLPELMEYLEDNNDVSYRICLQEILDKFREDLRPQIINSEDGWEKHNYLASKYLEIEELYTQLMENLVEEHVQKEEE